ncbi:MAG: Bug family tripartite tricarboxylate transporter substrate binding protein [Burkholderiales bacterium]
MYRPSIWLLAAAFASLATAPIAVSAADYPTKPVKIVVTYPPGGGMDVMARVLAGPLGQRLKGTVIVENRPGAGGMIGAEHVAKAEPDGYTLIIAPADTHSINPHVYTNIRYNAQRDFAPVAQLGNLPMTLVVNPKLPAKSAKEFVSYVRERPGKVTYSSWGIGSSSHVAMETLMLDGKLNMLHVPFTGAAPAIAAVIGGQVDAMMVTLPTSEPQHKTGKVRLIGVTPIQRPSGAPTYPTAGMPKHVAAWIGILAPAKTPKDIVQRLNKEFRSTLEDTEVRAGLVKAGLEPVARVGTPAEFAAFLATQHDLWGKTVRTAKIAVELK